MSSYGDINEILKSVDYVQGLIRSNVNFEASIEAMYLTIKEHIHF